MRINISCCFLLVLACIPLSTVGQSFTAFKKAGDEAYKTRDFNAAMHYYEQALAKKEQDCRMNFQYAMAAYHFFAFETAEQHFQNVLKCEDASSFPETYFYLGLTNKVLSNYEKAIENFNLYLNTKPGKAAEKQTAEHIATCGRAMDLSNVQPEHQITHLGKSINTSYSEFGAIKRGDTLYYSSFRFNNKADRANPPRKISKTLISVRNGRGRLLRRFNADEKHTANIALSLDGNRIYYNLCEYKKGLEITCALFYKTKDKRGRWRNTGKALPDTINLKGFTATQPAIGWDTLLKKEVLFFTSNRPGGKGGMDIWKVVVEDKNNFGFPTPVTEVNTGHNEISPFFDSDSQQLYFSSDRPRSLGGYDVFASELSEEVWIVDQLPAPINSSYNDIYFTLNQDGETGYFSSNRPGSFYLDKASEACCNDIYFFQPKPPEPEIDTTSFVPPEMVPEPEVVDEPEVEKEPETLQDFLPLALYFDNDEPDKRTRKTVTRKNYDETFRKYIRKKELFMQKFAEPLEEEQQEEANTLVESFFESEVKKGHQHLMLFSEILLKRLEQGEEVEIFIKGFTSPRAKSDYNLSLGKRRVSCLRNHFNDYKAGVFQEYINKDMLRISERSFGETSAASNVSDALEDLRNSIYSPAASRERRVEIVEIIIGED